MLYHCFQNGNLKKKVSTANLTSTGVHHKTALKSYIKKRDFFDGKFCSTPDQCPFADKKETEMAAFTLKNGCNYPGLH